MSNEAWGHCHLDDTTCRNHIWRSGGNRMRDDDKRGKAVTDQKLGEMRGRCGTMRGWTGGGGRGEDRYMLLERETGVVS
jgi:hypothetical protein